MLKKYINLFSSSLPIMLVYLICFTAYQIFYAYIMRHIDTGHKPIYFAIIAGQFIGKLMIALYTVAIAPVLVCKMAGSSSCRISENLKHWVLPYFLWIFIVPGLLSVLPEMYLSMSRHSILSVAWPILIGLLFMKFALWLPMGIYEKLPFREAVPASWKRLNTCWAFAIYAAGFAQGWLMPYIKMLMSKTGLHGLPLTISGGFINGFIAYLVLLFMITVYWNILRKEGKAQ